jgi:hypothetical protein
MYCLSSLHTQGAFRGTIKPPAQIVDVCSLLLEGKDFQFRYAIRRKSSKLLFHRQQALPSAPKTTRNVAVKISLQTIVKLVSQATGHNYLHEPTHPRRRVHADEALSLLNRRSFSAHIAPTASALMYTCFPHSAAKQSSSLKFNRFSPTNCEIKDGFKPMFQNPKQGSARSV